MFRLILNKGKPSDIIPREAITIEGKKVIIDTEKMTIGFKDDYLIYIPEIPPTKSMKPNFGEGNNNILIYPNSDEDKKRLVRWLWWETKHGKDNVAVYQGYRSIIHRCIKVAYDRSGRFFKFRGDNNLSSDHKKVRDKDILAISIGNIH